MKGNDKLIDKLNDSLADELTALNQYMVHEKYVKTGGMKGSIKLSKKAIV
jgi:bacterioferritin (cytochrome b1)